MSPILTQHLEAIQRALAPVFAPFLDGLDASDFLVASREAVPALIALRSELGLSGTVMHELVVETVSSIQAWAKDHDNKHIPNWIEGPADAALGTEFVRNLAVAQIEKGHQKALATLGL